MSDFIDSNYLQSIADKVLSLAKKYGANSAEVALNRGNGVSIAVRQQQMETIESIQDQGLSVSVYFNEKKGNASCSDFSALEKTVAMACDIAKYTQGDMDFGLADDWRLADKHKDLQLYFPWDVSSESLVDMALSCESAALESSKKISNSEGASIDTSRSLKVYANSHGFNDYSLATRYELSCSVVAGTGDAMQRDYDYTIARNYKNMQEGALVGKKAAEKAVAKLNAQSIKTGTYPVIFDATVAPGLFGHLLQGISGMAIYHKTSFLVDSLEKTLFPEFVCLEENPLLVSGLSSAAFDVEGVKTKAKPIVSDGVLQTYLLGSYSARKLGMTTTANAGGVFNLSIKPTLKTQQALLQQMHTGFLITEFMGSGVNMMTGDYSRGASGFWVENGIVQYPVDELTVAGNLKEMWLGIIAIADDIDIRRSTKVGSVLIDKMVVSGQ